MKRTTRIFIFSLCATLLIFALAAGVTEVESTGQTMFGMENKTQADSHELLLAAQTADNAMRMFLPVTRAALYGFLGAAGWVAEVC